jgi:copper homeostasis protein
MHSKLKTQNSTLLEICAGSIASALAAQEGGADRIELCDNLEQGGTTPSAGTIILVKKMLSIPVFVLIRPRTGDFLYSEEEFEVMKQDIVFCKEHRAEGVVLGVLNEDGTVDMKRTAELVDLAGPMQVTFHRAFDMTSDPFKAMEDIISLGIKRILTSGQAATALEGAQLIQQLNNRTNNSLSIMPGGGNTEDNVRRIIELTGAREIHASLRSKVDGKMIFRNNTTKMGSEEEGEYSWLQTDSGRVRVVKSLVLSR